MRQVDARTFTHSVSVVPQGLDKISCACAQSEGIVGYVVNKPLRTCSGDTVQHLHNRWQVLSIRDLTQMGVITSSKKSLTLIKRPERLGRVHGQPKTCSMVASRANQPASSALSLNRHIYIRSWNPTIEPATNKAMVPLGTMPALRSLWTMLDHLMWLPNVFFRRC